MKYQLSESAIEQGLIDWLMVSEISFVGVEDGLGLGMEVIIGNPEIIIIIVQDNGI